MGTRADFYIGRGKDAEWLGSIAWDGYPEGIDKKVLRAKTEKGFRSLLSKFFSSLEDVSLPKDGWPWPWEDSNTSDYAYSFDNGKVYACPFGRGWHVATFKPSDAWYERREHSSTEFPNMKDRMKVSFGKRSGLIVVSA